MKRDPRAFLNDIVEAVRAILDAVDGITLEHYQKNRLIRSSVEREFTIIGEALSRLSQCDHEIFSKIRHAPQIISFRNKITHEYNKIDSRLVWGVIETELPLLVEHCRDQLHALNQTDEQ